MPVELKWMIIAAIAISVLVIQRSNVVRAEVRARFGRLARQIERGWIPACAKPCDIVLIRDYTFLGGAIRFLTRRVGESRTEVNHVGIVVKKGSPPAKATIVEALGKVKRHSLGERYGNGRSDVAIYRRKGLSCAEKEKILSAADQYVGASYGYAKIVLHFLDALLLGFVVFRRLACLHRYPICSWVVAQSYKKAQKQFGVAAKAATPDDIWDHIKNHPKDYKCIRELRPF